MRRSLAFKCPQTGVIAIRGIDFGDLTRGYASQLLCEVECPCGKHHLFPLGEARFFDRYFDERAAAREGRR